MYMNGTHQDTIKIHAGYIKIQDQDTYPIADTRKLYPNTIGDCTCTSHGFSTGVTHKVSDGERKFEVGLQGSGFACCS
jgi:hypothetical protein